LRYSPERIPTPGGSVVLERLELRLPIALNGRRRAFVLEGNWTLNSIKHRIEAQFGRACAVEVDGRRISFENDGTSGILKFWDRSLRSVRGRWSRNGCPTPGDETPMREWEEVME
jgi:hypothetical protein